VDLPVISKIPGGIRFNPCHVKTGIEMAKRRIPVNCVGVIVS
jgi:hypothetical protein